jgi:hypothetical protein
MNHESTFLDLLTWTLVIVFVVLKLSHVIEWSWWFVFTPIYVLCLIATFSSIIDCLKIKPQTPHERSDHSQNQKEQ